MSDKPAPLERAEEKDGGKVRFPPGAEEGLSALEAPSTAEDLVTGGGKPTSLLKGTIVAFFEDDVVHWGGALAYYSLISLAPLVVLGVTVFGKLVGRQEAEAWILDQVRLLGGPRVVELVGTVLEETTRPELGSVGAIVTLAVFLLGTTAVFTNLQGALNRIWGVRAPEGGVIRNLLKTRTSAFLMVLALGGLMVVSVVVGTLVSWLGPLLDPLEAILPFVRVAELVSSVILLWLFVAATYVILPNARVHWRDVWVGALATAILLYLGKFGLAAFLARNGFASLYGAAGSLFLVLMWVYFSSQVFFLGAEFTQVLARRQGRMIHPRGIEQRGAAEEVEKGPAGEASSQ